MFISNCESCKMDFRHDTLIPLKFSDLLKKKLDQRKLKLIKGKLAKDEIHLYFHIFIVVFVDEL